MGGAVYWSGGSPLLIGATGWYQWGYHFPLIHGGYGFLRRMTRGHVAKLGGTAFCRPGVSLDLSPLFFITSAGLRGDGRASCRWIRTSSSPGLRGYPPQGV